MLRGVSLSFYHQHLALRLMWWYIEIPLGDRVRRISSFEWALTFRLIVWLGASFSMLVFWPALCRSNHSYKAGLNIFSYHHQLMFSWLPYPKWPNHYDYWNIWSSQLSRIFMFFMTTWWSVQSSIALPKNNHIWSILEQHYIVMYSILFLRQICICEIAFTLSAGNKTENVWILSWKRRPPFKI